MRTNPYNPRRTNPDASAHADFTRTLSFHRTCAEDDKHANPRRAASMASAIRQRQLIDTSQRLISKVIRTLEANGFTFSATDRDDMMQAGQLALVESGFYESGIVTKNTFRAISRKIESRDCMRLNCRWEHTCGEFNVLEEIGACHEYERKGTPFMHKEKYTITCTDGKAQKTYEIEYLSSPPCKMNKSTRDAIRACFHALRAAMNASESRKRKSEYAGHRNFLVACIAAATGKGNIPPMNPATFRKRKSRFLTYLQCGAKELSGTLDKGQALAREILRNLELNAMSS